MIATHNAYYVVFFNRGVTRSMRDSVFSYSWKAGHRIHPGGLNGGVPEDIRQSNHILFHTVEGEGEQNAAELCGKTLLLLTLAWRHSFFIAFQILLRSSGLPEFVTKTLPDVIFFLLQ